uniref:Uncharacterized protein n=1 Tax=Pseudomonas fluorescens (strain SBW25) TaxID=216595 RepID=A4V7D6_PSEFS|nr:hypothetical protein pQBR0166 [Pseudomonas fluorescens SBW25]
MPVELVRYSSITPRSGMRSDRCNVDQVANLAWTKACCAAGGGGHLFIAVRIERKSRSILRKLARALLISISTAQARRGVHGKFASRKHRAKNATWAVSFARLVRNQTCSSQGISNKQSTIN